MIPARDQVYLPLMIHRAAHGVQVLMTRATGVTTPQGARSFRRLGLFPLDEERLQNQKFRTDGKCQFAMFWLINSLAIRIPGDPWIHSRRLRGPYWEDDVP